MIYLDNAATSYPKPRTVVNAVKNSFINYGANPGRSGHKLSVKTALEVYEAREILNEFFDGYGGEFVSFTSNCTEALNVAIKGVLTNGDHVVISSFEHNSVTRPLHFLKEKGLISYSVFDVCDSTEKTIENFKNAIKPNTKLAVVTAVSNVFGRILPLEELGEIAKNKGVLFFVDGAQGAGIIPINMKKMNISCLCIPGHKGLLGPMGTGAILHNGMNFLPLIQGGTGSRSFDLLQPSEYPDRLESGTLNVPGICGLKEGVRVVKSMGVDRIFEEENFICNEIFKGLKNIKNVNLYEENRMKNNYAPVLSFNIEGKHSESVSAILDKHGIAVRGGFHCSPLAHNFMGTKQTGTVRISPSVRTDKKDINILLNLIRKIAFNEFI
ncbi:MAG: aminotransferase class V-fold PLP-dependent enzyme [Clostridia bacterium]|nr:aminotransferase class V-fold PLP-dependent enzyme [Clostridia bacterium]